MGLNVIEVTEKPDGTFIVRLNEALPSAGKVSKKVHDKPFVTPNKASKNTHSGGTILRINPSEYGVYFENEWSNFNLYSSCSSELVDVSRDLGPLPAGEKYPELLYVGCNIRSDCKCPLRDSSFVLEIATDKYKQLKETHTSVEQTHDKLRMHCSDPDACPPNKEEKDRTIVSLNKILERTEALCSQFERLNKRIKLDSEFFENRCGLVRNEDWKPPLNPYSTMKKDELRINK